MVRFFCGVRMTRYKTLSAAWSSGKWPRRRQACRNREFRLSQVIWSPVIERGCDLGCCVGDGVLDAAA